MQSTLSFSNILSQYETDLFGRCLTEYEVLAPIDESKSLRVAKKKLLHTCISKSEFHEETVNFYILFFLN